MFDEYEELNNDNTGSNRINDDEIESDADIALKIAAYENIIGASGVSIDDISADDIISAAYYGDAADISYTGDDAAVPDTVKSIDDALRVVDNSNLSPVPPNTIRPGTIADYTAPAPARPGTIKAGTAPDSSRHNTDTSILAAVIERLRNFNFSEIKELFTKKEPKDIAASYNEADKETGAADFKINFDFESAYKDPPENRPLRRRRERRTGLIGGIMLAVFILCTGLVAGSVFWLIVIDVLGFEGKDETVEVQVPEDFEMEGITDMLYEAGLIRYKSLFNIYAEYSSAEEKISPGAYVLNRNYDYRALVQGMTTRAGVRVETTVVIPEGLTLTQTFNLLENEGVCSAEELWDAATNYDFDFYFLDKETLGNRLRLEGFLFPDTYNFYLDSSAVRTISRLLREFDNKFTETYIERAEFLGYTVNEIVTIASMIEREAGSDEERSRIAAVIYNRLNNPSNYPMLEIDATIHYAIAGTGNTFSTQYDSEYNTYLYPGLPPGPIANPGLASIQAALYPDRTDEYFYALNRAGTHNFFKNAADHLDFVNSDEYGG